MEELVMWIGESGDFLGDDGNLIECSAREVADVIETSPQVAGKVMKCFDDLWERSIKNIDGQRRVIYTPKEDQR